MSEVKENVWSVRESLSSRFQKTKIITLSSCYLMIVSMLVQCCRYFVIEAKHGVKSRE